MKWNTRCLFLCVGVAALILITFQIIAVSDSGFNNRRMSIREHAQNIMKRGCTETFPFRHNVRIFSDGREVHHIFFLKVHKTSSGTVSSIYFRYGMTRGLLFVLPKHINSVSSYVTIDETNVYPRLNKSFDIMTSHVIYNKKAISSFLHPDTVYVGIVREPYLQFKSSMNYMAPGYVYNISKTDPIQQYLKNPYKYEPKNPRFSWINNRQSVEFGFPDKVIMTKNETGIREYIKKLDKDFHLVIVAEYFDESVVLMRRMFGWQLKDILYRKLHVRGWDRKNTEPRPHDRRLYRKYASVDYALYDFFFRRLWRKIKEAGDDFYEEVLHFKKVREEVEDFCKVLPNDTRTYEIPLSEWNTPTVVDKYLCRELYSEEEDWVKRIARKQYNIIKK